MRMLLLPAVCLALLPSLPAARDTPPPGLYLKDGVLLRAGSAYRAMGINYFQAFTDLIARPEHTAYVEGFRILRQDYRVPFIRLAGGPYNHKDWKLYDENPAEYFARFDRVVREAERQGLGLVPSLFWRTVSVPDYCGEPVGALGDPASKTRAFLRRYAGDVVLRYRSSPAIWGWEFGNEYLLAADLPQLDHLPPKKAGSKEERTAADKMTRPMIYSAYEEFHGVVRALDPHRIILTGDSLTRSSAWNNRHQDRWQSDTRAQWTEIFNADTPACYEMISFHLYPELDGGYFKDPGQPIKTATGVPMEEVIALALAEARRRGKPVWCGEFGEKGSGPETRAMVARLIRIIEDNRIDLSAPWNFVPVGKFQGGDGSHDISPTNAREFILDAVLAYNARHGALR